MAISTMCYKINKETDSIVILLTNNYLTCYHFNGRMYFIN